MSISFDKLDKYQVILNLWINTKYINNQPQMRDNNRLQILNTDILKEAKKILSSNQYIDYLLGKSIKTDFRNYPNLNPCLYDRDAGFGTMLKIKEQMSKNIKENNIADPQNRLTERDIYDLNKLNQSITDEDIEAINCLLSFSSK